MRHLVTGATGFIGSRVVERLVDRGDSVVALTRSRENAADLPDEVTVAEGDVTRPETLREPMADVDSLFHLAAWYQIGPGPENRAFAERVNVEGARNVFEMMTEADVEKGVYASTVGIYGDTGGEPIDESYRPGPNLPSVYQRTKWRTHYEVAEPMMEDGLPLVIATLGGIYGPGDKAYGGTPRSGLQAYLQDELPVIPSGFRIAWDHVEDTADALVSALADGRPGEEYIIGGDEASMVDFFEIAAEHTAKGVPTALPQSVFAALQPLAAAAEKVTTLPEGMRAENIAFFAGTDQHFDTSKADAEPDFEQRSLAAGLPPVIDWELEQLGMAETGG